MISFRTLKVLSSKNWFKFFRKKQFFDNRSPIFRQTSARSFEKLKFPENGVFEGVLLIIQNSSFLNSVPSFCQTKNKKNFKMVENRLILRFHCQSICCKNFFTKIILQKNQLMKSNSSKLVDQNSVTIYCKFLSSFLKTQLKVVRSEQMFLFKL